MVRLQFVNASRMAWVKLAWVHYKFEALRGCKSVSNSIQFTPNALQVQYLCIGEYLREWSIILTTIQNQNPGIKVEYWEILSEN